MNTLKHLVLLVALIAIHCVAVATDYVILSEVMYDTPLNENPDISPHNFGEFVEIYNAHTESSVNLQGWQLQTKFPPQSYTFPDMVLPPHAFLVVAYGTPREYNLTSATNGGWTDFHAIYECYVEYGVGIQDTMSVLFQTSLILPNDSCELRLVDANGHTRDSVRYGEIAYSGCNKHALNGSCGDINACSWCSLYSLRRILAEFDVQGCASSTYRIGMYWLGHCSNGDPADDDPDWYYHCTPGYAERAIGCLPLPESGSASPAINNYVQTITPLQATDTIPAYNLTEQIPNALNTITYYDGLGRSVQVTQKNITPTQKNLTSFTEYNRFGQVSKEWLPGITETVARYNLPAFKAISQYTYPNDTAAHQDYQYSTQVLANGVTSNALVSIRKPGDDMIGHVARQSRSANKANQVRLFRVTDDNDLVANGYYPATTLVCDSLIDEDNKNVVQFKDLAGQTILSRKAGIADTYYVYNRMGHLSYILPPNIVDSLALYDTIPMSDGRLRRWAYCYGYDNRGNRNYKRLPGCEPVWAIYDKANRLVLEQDGNMRDKGDGTWWMVYTYDLFGRLLYTYYAPTSCVPNDLEGLQQELVTASRTSNITYGYTNNWFPSQMKLLRVYYYDDYTFLNLLSATQRDSLTYAPLTGFGTKEASSVGRLTGERIYHLASDSYVTQVYYYDTRGRIMQTRATNSLGGYNMTWYDLGFADNVLKELHTHSDATGETIREQYTYSYDHANRLVDTRYQYRSEPEIVLSSESYDELGRGTQHRTHGIINGLSVHFTDTALYEYNIRNQLTHMQKYGFEENLYYTTPSTVQGSNPTYYNGNISSRIWTYGVRKNGYEYFYDNLNRLSYTYGIVNNQWADNMYMENFSYDKQGNILSLLRMAADNYFAPDLDYMNFSYNGNQVTKISDPFTPSGLSEAIEYNDLANMPNEMVYDKNGGLIADFDRNICTIRKNVLSLPDTIQFVNGNQIVHTYDAMGRKVQTTYYRKRVPVTLSQGNVLTTSINNTTDFIISSEHYNDNVSYTQPAGYSAPYLHRVSNPEGCMWYLGSYGEHYPLYYVRDYQGTIREVHILPEGNAQVLQRLQYYPSGLPWRENVGMQEDQPYRHQGKEWIGNFGLNEYDSEARWYYPAIARATAMDPHCEDYPDVSPYAWCNNNPVRFVDPSGEAWYEDSLSSIHWTDYTNQQQMDEAGLLGRHLGEVVLTINGFYDEKLGRGNNLWGGGAKLAIATLYGARGEHDVRTYDAFTMTSDFASYGAIANGEYTVTNQSNKTGPLGSHFLINDGAAVDCLNGVNPSTINPYSSTQKDKIWIHRSNANGDMLPLGGDGTYHPLSTGCLIIAPSRYSRNGNLSKIGWDQFVQQVGNVNKFLLKLNRK